MLDILEHILEQLFMLEPLLLLLVLLFIMACLIYVLVKISRSTPRPRPTEILEASKDYKLAKHVKEVLVQAGYYVSEPKLDDWQQKHVPPKGFMDVSGKGEFGTIHFFISEDFKMIQARLMLQPLVWRKPYIFSMDYTGGVYLTASYQDRVPEWMKIAAKALVDWSGAQVESPNWMNRSLESLGTLEIKRLLNTHEMLEHVFQNRTTVIEAVENDLITDAIIGVWENESAEGLSDQWTFTDNDEYVVVIRGKSYTKLPKDFAGYSMGKPVIDYGHYFVNENKIVLESEPLNKDKVLNKVQIHASGDELRFYIDGHPRLFIYDRAK